jgi:spore coat polysaccharide biosynthesis protein SpsF (cytidylyltransferase family)
MKISLITQARFGSTRLRGKILEKISKKTILQIHLENIKKSKLVTDFFVATTNEIESEIICNIAKKCKFNYFKGDINNVLSRFYHTVKECKPDYVVRVTSDCPLIDSILIDEVINYTIFNKFSYCSTSDEYPDGVDVEVFKFTELERAYINATLDSEKEHVTPYIKNTLKGSKDISMYNSNYNFRNVRFTLDEVSDLETIKILVNKFGVNARWYIYAGFIINNPQLFQNQSITRNQGYINSILKESQNE